MKFVERTPGTGWIDDTAPVPTWLEPLKDRVRGVPATALTRFTPPREGGRNSAVLVLIGETNGAAGLLITERSHTMRSHAGQPSFPGGAMDAGDLDARSCAMREAAEEVGLNDSGVNIFGALPDLWVPVSGFIVTPILAWWHTPGPVSVVDTDEVASVHRVSIADLVDPDNRLQVRHPSGYVGMGFRVHGLLVWGFTAGIISGLLDFGGWAQPWDRDRIEDLEGPAA